MKVLFLLDPAHGENTPGKRSPDGRFLEWQWSREFINLLLSHPNRGDLDMACLVNESNEIGLSARVRRYNEFETDATKVMISIHVNAAGNGESWMKGRGFEIWTTKGQTRSDQVAEIFGSQIKEFFPDLSFRADMADDDLDKESNFTVLTGTGYLAILTENLFQDNEADVELLLSSDFNNQLAECYLSAMRLVRDMM